MHSVVSLDNRTHAALIVKKSKREKLPIISAACEMMDEIETSSPDSFYCNECNRAFSDLLKLQFHLESCHFPSKSPKREATSQSDHRPMERKEFDNIGVDKKEGDECTQERTKCSECSKFFMNASSLKTHMRKFHNFFFRNSMACPLVGCNYFCAKLNRLISHLNDEHNQKIVTERLSFSTEAEYAAWLSKVEREVPCNFLKDKEAKTSSTKTSYYYCNRSGERRIAKEQHDLVAKRQVKAQGSCKIRRTCPAHFIKYTDCSGTVDVRYVSQHYCFTNRFHQLGHIRLSKKDKEWVAGKLAVGVSVSQILREARSEPVSDDRMSRKHLLTSQDVRNIAKAFKISRPLSPKISEDGDEEVCPTIEDLLRNYDGDSNPPVLLYKRFNSFDIKVFYDPVDSSVAGKCLPSDFFFVYSNRMQREALALYANGNQSVVCIGTTRIGPDDSWLVSLSILDTNWQVLPAALLYCNRLDFDIVTLFFTSLRHKCNLLNCSILVTEPFGVFFDTWVEVMGSKPYHLLYTSLVESDFKEKTKLMISGDKELSNVIFQKLKNLITELDQDAFRSSLDSLLSEFRQNPSTFEFANYFCSKFLPITDQWAVCFRTGFSFDAVQKIPSRPKLDRFDGVLKVYEKFKDRPNSRDAVAWALVSLVQDQQFDKLLAACKGKIKKRLTDIQTRHKSSLSLDVRDVFPAKSGHEWYLRSEVFDFHFYVVKRLKESCYCSLICSQCQACIHMFSCTCPDSSQFFNMCQHVHLVCSRLNAPADASNRSDLPSSDRNSFDASQIYLKFCDSVTELKDKANRVKDVGTLRVVHDSVKSMISMIEAQVQISNIVTSSNQTATGSSSFIGNHGSCDAGSLFVSQESKSESNENGVFLKVPTLSADYTTTICNIQTYLNGNPELRKVYSLDQFHQVQELNQDLLQVVQFNDKQFSIASVKPIDAADFRPTENTTDRLCLQNSTRVPLIAAKSSEFFQTDLGNLGPANSRFVFISPYQTSNAVNASIDNNNALEGAEPASVNTYDSLSLNTADQLKIVADDDDPQSSLLFSQQTFLQSLGQIGNGWPKI